MKLSAVGLAVLLGCGSVGSSTGGTELTVSPDRLAPGDSASLFLSSGAEERIGYNLCPSSLSRRAGNDWVLVQSDRVCTMELRTLEPGGRDSFRLQLPQDLPAGEYRFETEVVELDTDSRHSLATEPFTVE